MLMSIAVSDGMAPEAVGVPIAMPVEVMSMAMPVEVMLM
jgi:hypothetical protein